MKQSRANIRYAKAFLQLSLEQNQLDRSYKDMMLLDAICSESKELVLLLKSPIVKTDQKLKIFDQIFAKKVSDLSMKFLNIIISKKRESILPYIAKSFILLYKTQNKIETAVVTTAQPISQELKNKVLTYVKKETKNSIELIEVVDEKISGGVIIKLGDKQLDASVLTIISELKQTFNKNLYVQDF